MYGKISGKTILEHQLSTINPINIEKLVIVLGYKSEILANYVKSLNLPYPVSFTNNSNYPNNKCGASLISSFTEVKGPIIFLIQIYYFLRKL